MSKLKQPTSLLFPALVLILTLFAELRPICFWLLVLAYGLTGLSIRLSPLPLINTTTFRLVLFVQLLSSFWNLSEGTFQILQPIPGLADIFDVVGTRLLQGLYDLPKETISFEAFVFNGKHYSYWGIIPSIFRIPLNFLFPQYFGQWSRLLSCLAGTMSWISMGLLLNYCLTKAALTTRERSRLFALGLICLLYASPLYHLLSHGMVYHEIMLWGFAGSTWALLQIIPLLESLRFGNAPRLSALFSLSFWSSFAILSRPTFGLPGALAFTLFALIRAREDFRNAPSSIQPFKKAHLALQKLILPALPLFLSAIFLLFYNHVRSGSPFTFVPLDKYILFSELPQDEIPPAFSSHALLHNLQTYFFPRSYFVHSSGSLLFPWPRRSSSYFPFYVYREWTIPLSIVWSWLLALAGLGLIKMITNRNLTEWLIVSFFGIQVVLILEYFFTTLRYTAELFPFLLLLASLFLLRQNLHHSVPRFAHFFFSLLLPIVMLYSAAANVYAVRSTIAYGDFYSAPGLAIQAQSDLVHWNALEQVVISLLQRSEIMLWQKYEVTTD